MAASVVLHAAAVLLWPAGPEAASPSGTDEDRRRPAVREGIQAVELPSSRPAADERETPPAVDIPDPSRRPAAVERLARMDPVPVRAPVPRWAGSGGGAASGEPGEEAASGAGDGPGEEGLSPPVPRSLLPDWSPPEEVRGHRVTVRVEVDERGRPTGRVELVPPTPSQAFNRELRRRMTRLEFTPGRRDERAVTAWAEITFTFGG